MDGVGVFSPLWLCQRHQPLHVRVLLLLLLLMMMLLSLLLLLSLSLLLFWLCVRGREGGVDWLGVFSPLWLCLRYQPLHGCVLPVVADAAAADVADVVVADVVVVVAVVVVFMVMYVW